MPLDALQLMQGYRARDLANMGAQQRMNIVPQELAMRQQQAVDQARQRKALADLQGQQMMQRVQQGRQLAAYQAATTASRDMDRASREKVAVLRRGTQQGPLTSEGKINADLSAGRITSEQAQEMRKGRTDVIPPEHANLTGAEYLKTLPIGVQNNIKGLVEGDINPMNFSIRNNERDRYQQMAIQTDPSYNNRRFLVKNEMFGKGVVKNNVTNLNQAILHMNTLNDLNAAIENGDVQSVNKAINAVRTQFGRSEVTSAQLAQQAVSEELMRVFRGAGAGSEREAKDFENKLFSTQGSPKQQRDAIKTGMELLNGRLKTLGEQYAKGMGHERFTDSMLMPSAKAAYDNLMRGGGGSTPAAPAAAPMFAVNPQTKERITSTDGGKTWQPAK